jgi:O-antigen ligase
VSLVREKSLISQYSAYVSSAVESSLADKLIAYTPFAMVLAISPWQSLDSINLPKLLILITCAGAVLGISISHGLATATRKIPKAAAWIYAGLFVSLVLTFVTSGSPYIQQFYGANGRNTGLIAYIALLIFALASILHESEHLVEKFIKALILGGQVTSAYCLIQFFGADPIDWNNPYSPILGFLGNPNFASAFLGISSVAALALLFFSKSSNWIRLIYFLQIALSIFLILQSNSQQGLLVIACGSVVIIGWKIVTTKNRLLFFLYSLMVSVSGIAGILGMLRIGPLSGYLYQDSITYRGDYWRAAINMARENPIFGVGLDSYGDWYRRSRTIEATVRRGPDTISNAAHNVYLDMLANGGYLLFILYLASVVLVIRSIGKIAKRGNSLPSSYIALISCWVAFQIQSIISINQLGLAIWGWIFGGLIIGYENNLRSERPRRTLLKEAIPPNQIVASFLGVLLGLAISVPPFYASSQFKSALESRNANAIFDGAKAFPLDPIRLTSAATIFIENKMETKTQELLRLSATTFPSDFQTWNLISQSEYFTKDERESAIEKMKFLDPNNKSISIENK